MRKKNFEKNFHTAMVRNGSELLSKRKKREKVFKNLPIISLTRI